MFTLKKEAPSSSLLSGLPSFYLKLKTIFQAQTSPKILYLPPRSAAASQPVATPRPCCGRRMLMSIIETLFLLTNTFPALETIDPSNEERFGHLHLLGCQHRLFPTLTSHLTSSLFDFISVTVTSPETAKTIATIIFFPPSLSDNVPNPSRK